MAVLAVVALAVALLVVVIHHPLHHPKVTLVVVIHQIREVLVAVVLALLEEVGPVQEQLILVVSVVLVHQTIIELAQLFFMPVAVEAVEIRLILLALLVVQVGVEVAVRIVYLP